MWPMGLLLLILASATTTRGCVHSWNSPVGLLDWEDNQRVSRPGLPTGIRSSSRSPPTMLPHQREARSAGTLVSVSTISVQNRASWPHHGNWYQEGGNPTHEMGSTWAYSNYLALLIELPKKKHLLYWNVTSLCKYWMFSGWFFLLFLQDLLLYWNRYLFWTWILSVWLYIVTNQHSILPAEWRRTRRSCSPSSKWFVIAMVVCTVYSWFQSFLTVMH